MRTEAERVALILAETVVAAPPLCPEIRLHLVTDACRLWRATEQDLDAMALPAPYWAFAWAGGQALARYLLDHPDVVEGRTVLDFGSGGAVEGVAAARSGATSVLCADIDPFAASVAGLNGALNTVTLGTTTDDLIGAPVEADVVLAGDVTYDDEMARAVRAWLERLAAEGRTVLVADPGRGFLDTAGFEEVAAYPAPTDVDADGSDRVRTPVYRVRGPRVS